MTHKSSVSISRVFKRHGPTTVLDNVHLEVPAGEFMVLVGPSGSGKSSLMRMIAGLDRPDEGRIEIDGKDAAQVPPSRRGIAMVFQNYALYPHMTVAQNMGFSLKMAGSGRGEIESAVRRTAETLRIAHLLERKPATLSGGQRQRVAIGRALVRRPRLFLFDEPLSNLDSALREDMRLELVRLHRELGTTMIYVTHDQTEAMTLADRIAVFNHGRIEQVGRPLDIYDAPATAFVASVLGSPRINIMEGRVTRHGDRVALCLPGYPPLALSSATEGLEQAIRFGVRPENWMIGSEQDWPVTVDVIEQLGDSAILHVVPANGEGERLSVRVGASVARHIAAGDRIGISPQPGTIACFTPEGRCMAMV